MSTSACRAVNAASWTSHSVAGRDQGYAEVLLLDDDSTMLGYLEEALAVAGVRCVMTRSPSEALEACERLSSINVVVTDVFMPQMNGLEFVGALRSKTKSSSSPQVLFLTGYPSVQTAVDALRLGACDFLTKPVRPRQFIDAVRRALSRAHAEQETTRRFRNEEIVQIAFHASSLAERLNQMASQDAARPASVRNALPPVEESTLLDMLRTFRELQRRLCDRQLDEIAWDLLLELARARHQGQTLSVSDLMLLQCSASPTTLLRRINKLEDLGYVSKLPDPADRRREFVSMTDSADTLVSDFLLGAIERTSGGV